MSKEVTGYQMCWRLRCLSSGFFLDNWPEMLMRSLLEGSLFPLLARYCPHYSPVFPYSSHYFPEFPGYMERKGSTEFIRMLRIYKQCLLSFKCLHPISDGTVHPQTWWYRWMPLHTDRSYWHKTTWRHFHPGAKQASKSTTAQAFSTPKYSGEHAPTFRSKQW